MCSIKCSIWFCLHSLDVRSFDYCTMVYFHRVCPDICNSTGSDPPFFISSKVSFLPNVCERIPLNICLHFCLDISSANVDNVFVGVSMLKGIGYNGEFSNSAVQEFKRGINMNLGVVCVKFSCWNNTQ